MASLFSLNKKRDPSEGAAAEELAARHLQKQGLRLLERNYRVRGGEIDLVMQEGETLVFVEVRLRRSGRYGGALESIDAHKRARILLAAKHRLGGRDLPCRFDVVVLDDLREARIEWLRDAFHE
jgi:putative endonuclease